MPTWDKVLKEFQDEFNALGLLSKFIEELHKKTGRTTICYFSAFTIIKPPVPQPFHAIIDQDIQGFMTCSKDVGKEELDLIIHTPGGDYEATKQIINYLLGLYKHIRVIIPHKAMSGGTLIACSADEILMGPYSSIGPTDPQIFLNGAFVPVDAILNEFKEAFTQVSADPKTALLWNERLKKVPFGMFKAIENMKQNSATYLEKLLKQRNCKDKSPEEITEIAKFLNSHEAHSSHGRAICLDDAKNCGLNVQNLRDDQDLEDLVLSIYHAATILFQNSTVQKFVVNHSKQRYINQFQG